MNSTKIKQSFILFRILTPIFFIGLTIMSIIMTQNFADRVRMWYKREYLKLM